jgi:hypothetical protein
MTSQLLESTGNSRLLRSRGARLPGFARRTVSTVDEREAHHVSSDAADTDVEDARLNLHEIRETTRGRPFGQAVGMAVADRDGPVEPNAARAAVDERRDRP